MQLRRLSIVIAALAVALVACRPKAVASEVPIGGFLPLVGIALTNEFDDDFNTFAVPSPQPGGLMLGKNGAPHYDIALLDTGAAASLLSAQAHDDFMMNGPYPGEPDGFRGSETIQIGGASGTFFADINDPVGLYVGGLQNRNGTGSLILDNDSLRGQTNTSLITLPAESDLPSIVGLTFASRYATRIRNDQPQVFEHNGRTVRTPHIEFLPLGSGGQGIVRRAPLSLNPGASFAQAPFWFYNFENFDINRPHENPSLPTLIQGAMFLNVNVANDGEQLTNTEFFFDTGASVTVVSELNASRLGFDPVLDAPEFTVAVLGSGGTLLEVPGFFVDQFTIQALGGNLTLNNVPVIVLDVTNPADPGNVVDGIVGTNLLAGRNVVIDPNPSLGGGGVGPSLYISDPVTVEWNWNSAAAVGQWSTDDHWSSGARPTLESLAIANAHHVAGDHQSVVVDSDASAWELNVSGTASQSMTLQIEDGTRLTTFANTYIEEGGIIELHGATLDTQTVEIRGGSLRGVGYVATGSGPIPGQVENRSGTILPGNGVGTLHIEGRFSNGHGGTLGIELGGTEPGTDYDQLIVDGGAALAGTLEVTLVDLGGGLFAPSPGDSFTILSASDGLSGQFHTLLLPDDDSWDIAYGPNSVVLSFLGSVIAGDFNGDGLVDAADYTTWRDSGGTAGQFNQWKANFGQSTGDSAAAIAAAVPEPSAAILLLAGLSLAAACLRPTTRFASSLRAAS